MAVKVLITRRFKKGKAVDLLKLMNQLRATAINQAGYITGETLMSQDDPQKMVVIAAWEDTKNWEHWKTDPVRKSYESQMEELLEEEPRYEVYALGTFPRK